MDVVLMMFSHAEGTTLLGTHKLEQFIVTTELCRFTSMMCNRPPLYRPALDCTVANDFVSTEFERYIDLVEDNVSVYVIYIYIFKFIVYSLALLKIVFVLTKLNRVNYVLKY